MSGRQIHFLLGKNLDVDSREITRQNRLAIHYLACGGIPVSLANVLAQSIIQGVPMLTLQSLWLIGYYLLLFFLDQFVIPRSYARSTSLVYLLEAPIMLVSILLGSVWDPTHQAITFLMFLLALPAFILDKPIRLMAIMLGWTLLFVGFSFAVKDTSIFMSDLVHAIEFLLLSILVSYMVLKLRFEVMYGLERAKYHLEHDVLTDLQNRLCLEVHSNKYVGKPLFVAMGNVDHLTMLNDFYGRDSGDLILTTFTEELKHTFGMHDSYRFDGDDMLCIAIGSTEREGIALLDRCRSHLEGVHEERYHTHLSYSFGYVTGTPADVEELHKMLQLANIYVHRARKQGGSKTIGGAYDDEALRKGTIEAHTSTSAHSYEINQLTQLPTMTYFVVRCDEALHHIVDLDRSPVVGYLNIDRFRDYNDVFGYEHGDKLICLVADLLKESFPGRHIAYITGSQFAVMCYREEVRGVMRKVSEALLSHNPKHPVVIRAGFAEYHDGESTISLLDKAKLAHQNVRSTVEGDYRFYDSGLDQEIRFRRYLTSHIDSAIDRGWLKVHYQPIVRASDGKICNLEALSRWNDPVYGLLPPSQFISTLESEHIIYKLSLNVVKQVLRDLRHMKDLHLPLVPVSVNLSRNDFSECDMVEAITNLVDEAEMPRNCLCIEITESAFVEKQEFLRHEVDRFRANGFAVWMDDVGSEYSTLNLLQGLNFDLIKIDMQFMRGFTPTGRNAVIVAHIIDMCNQLGVTTLVEGVEEVEQRDSLVAMGSDKLQGYLFSPPRTLPDIMSMAETKKWC